MKLLFDENLSPSLPVNIAFLSRLHTGAIST